MNKIILVAGLVTLSIGLIQYAQGQNQTDTQTRTFEDCYNQGIELLYSYAPPINDSTPQYLLDLQYNTFSDFSTNICNSFHDKYGILFDWDKGLDK
jgi:hypothetical protein